MPPRPEDWPRVREVFEQALALPGLERTAYVAAACGDDAAVHDEILRMLDSHARAGTFLSTPAIDLLGQTGHLPSFEGQQIGPYHVLARIGAGGMGEVYKAFDTRLDRTVAIKVLPSDANDQAARERFEREGRAIAALSHPHICVLYDIGQLPVADAWATAPIRYLVMEHLEGETLADRLARRPLSLSDALQLAVQIASALDTAHRAGIVHRDLKPGNVFLLRQGSPAGLTAKLLDFGLAKPLAAPVGCPTIQMAGSQGLTTPGMILGTVQYMAPEQLEGKNVDARTDIFAFGALAYEMIAGRKAFEGGSQARLIAAILHDDPPRLSSIEPLTPPHLDRIVATCLAKDPDDRWQTARDLLRELTWARNGSVGSGTPPTVGRRSFSVMAWASVLIVALAAMAGILSVRRAPSPPLPVISFSVYPPAGTKFPRGTAEMAVSPDGSRLVFVALSADSIRHLWVRRFDSVSARMLDGTANALYPFWSPDSRSIGFFTTSQLLRIPEAGGPAQVLCDMPFARGGTWSRDGVILFAAGDSGQIHRIAETGGPATPVTMLDVSRKERSHTRPAFLADGRRFLYLARSDDEKETGIYAGSLDSRQTRRVLTNRSNVSPAGAFLLSLSDRALVAHAYDADRAQVVGEPITIAAPIAFDNPERSGSPFASNDSGILAYRSASPDSHLVWFDRAGKQVGSLSEPADYHHPSLASDDRRVAIEKTDPATGHHSVWIADVSRGLVSRLLFDRAGAHTPVWSPDGHRVAFASNRAGAGAIDIYVTRTDNVAGDERLLGSGEKVSQLPSDWSVDGRYLLYSRGQRPSDLWVLPVAPLEKPQPFLATPADEIQGRFSPDGQWIAYSSNESGTYEVYVRRFPGGDGKWQVSTHGGAQPQWRYDGKELFYLAPDGTIMATAVKDGRTIFETAAPHELFNTGIKSQFVARRNHYVVTRDGQRFLVNISAEDEDAAPITVMLNWNARLRN
jgi:eukaryotic-like serine/threonine-protein kinase